MFKGHTPFEEKNIEKADQLEERLLSIASSDSPVEDFLFSAGGDSCLGQWLDMLSKKS
jgi:hypothetical protein